MKRRTNLSGRGVRGRTETPAAPDNRVEDDTQVWEDLTDEVEPMDLVPPPPSEVVAARLQRAIGRAEFLWRFDQDSLDENALQGSENAARVQLLASLWPFSELPSAVLRALSGRMREKRFAGGQKIIHQGSRSRHLLIVIEGTIEVHVQAGSRRHVLARLDRGAIVGEMSLLTDAPCTATVTAVGPVRAAAISAGEFRRLAARYPVLGSTLSHLVASRLGQAPVDTLTGKVLHGYRLRRCVGRGGMGIVYEAKRLADGQRVALKMLSHRFAYDLEVQQRFEREIQICRSLCHAAIPRILDHFTAFGTNFMVMEFCDGVTLDEFIRAGGPLDEQQVRSIVGQLATALSHIHRHGICHRDVKPRNIIISDERGTVRLMDFGLATSLASCELTQYGCVLGTPRYMPPEQLAGQRVDYRADLFSLGCVVYEMLTGMALFGDGDVAMQLLQDPNWSMPPADRIRPGLSGDLHQFLCQTVAVDPRRRVVALEEIGNTWSSRTSDLH
ncbi:MAG: protein kinase [Pirellulales bacterium]|nr:protein kinase [Pirellulales bacterium]